MTKKKAKLIMAAITIFIIMPLNGFLFTRYPAWFPIILILCQVPSLVSILKEWYKNDEIDIVDQPLELRGDNENENLDNDLRL